MPIGNTLFLWHHNNRGRPTVPQLTLHGGVWLTQIEYHPPDNHNDLVGGRKSWHCIFNIKYNPKKSKIMIVQTIYLWSGWLALPFVCTHCTVRLITHTDPMTFVVCCKFSMCSVVPVKISLFRSFCTQLYTAHLWCCYRWASIRRLKVAYNDCMMLMLLLLLLQCKPVQVYV